MRWVALGNPGGVGGVAGDHVPHNVGGHKAKGTSNVELWTLVSGLGFDVLEPGLEVGSRVIGEGVGKVESQTWWMDGWMDGWIDG